jgi:hypothetical protein
LHDVRFVILNHNINNNHKTNQKAHQSVMMKVCNTPLTTHDDVSTSVGKVLRGTTLMMLGGCTFFSFVHCSTGIH